MKKLKVIFRKDRKDGTVIAFLPDSQASRGCIMCYEHIGQHGEASLDYYWSTISATEAEYKLLFEEMDRIYRDDCYGTEEPIQLVIGKRLNYDVLCSNWR